jgi:signal transduction histidine kinase/HPt (histidine-containing phosphotransfer) domain-containing protein/ActR/RegA family two-component response regulator
VNLPTRLRVWARPDSASARAGREGEIFAAGVRLWTAAVAGLIPLWHILFRPPDLEPRVGLLCVLLTLLLAFWVRSFARRAQPPWWLGFFTCILDVSIVSLANLSLVAGGQPLAVTNGRVFFCIYFLALAFACLRQDVRMCLAAGLAAILQYGAIVLWVVSRSAASGVVLSSHTYGTFRLDNQIGRLILLALATAVNVAIVHQSRDLRRQRDRAEEASHSKSEFLANMSHEIRTPLNAVLGMMSLLLETPLSETQREYVATTRSSGAALLGVINDLLDVSKIEAGRLDLEIAPFLLRGCLDEAIGILTPKAEAHGLALHCQVADGVPAAVESDAARLRQILVNLLDNAIKFTPRGKVSLEVEAGAEKDGLVELRFAVRDTGIGIPADRMDRLFKPFSQGDSSMSRLYGGTGLGLVISQRLAERLGGRMWAESVVGRGSAFLFTIRCRPALAVPPPLPSGPAEPDTLAGPRLAERLPLRILLAEDNSVNQRVGLLMLERMGYLADVAGNGSEVLEALYRQPYDLILMDVQMPGLDGLEATRRIRAEFPREWQPRIVAMTANVLREQREACLIAGMDDFVQKPVAFDDLRTALARCGRPEPAPPPPEADLAVPEPAPAPPDDADDAFLLDPSYLDGLRQLGELSGKPILQEIVAHYLAETPRRLEKMRQALLRSDAAELNFVAHSLKGSSAQIGTVRIASLSAELERGSKDAGLPNSAELAGLLAELEREIARTLPLLEQAAAGAASPSGGSA